MYVFLVKFGTKCGKSFARSKRSGRSSRKLGRDSRFFALNEMNLSTEGGDSSNEEEKSRISVMKDTKKF